MTSFRQNDQKSAEHATTAHNYLSIKHLRVSI